MKQLKVFGQKVPRGVFSDPDKDGYPNPIDCHNTNPNKQGFLGSIGIETTEKPREEPREEHKKGLFSSIRGTIQDYRAKEPERRERKLEKIKHETEIAKSRTELAQLRAKESTAKMQSHQQRQKMMQNMPSMFGGSTGSKRKKVKPMFQL